MASTPATSTWSTRTGLAIAAAVTGLTLAGGATLAAGLGWLRPAAAAPVAAAVEPTSSTPLTDMSALPPADQPPLQVDASGNVWAWPSAGDRVLVQPAVAAAVAPASQAPRRESDHDHGAPSVLAARESFSGPAGTSTGPRREHDDD